MSSVNPVPLYPVIVQMPMGPGPRSEVTSLPDSATRPVDNMLDLISYFNANPNISRIEDLDPVAEKLHALYDSGGHYGISQVLSHMSDTKIFAACMRWEQMYPDDAYKIKNVLEGIIRGEDVFRGRVRDFFPAYRVVYEGLTRAMGYDPNNSIVGLYNRINIRDIMSNPSLWHADSGRCITGPIPPDGERVQSPGYHFGSYPPKPVERAPQPVKEDIPTSGELLERLIGETLGDTDDPYVSKKPTKETMIGYIPGGSGSHQDLPPDAKSPGQEPVLGAKPSKGSGDKYSGGYDDISQDANIERGEPNIIPDDTGPVNEGVGTEADPVPEQLTENTNNTEDDVIEDPYGWGGGPVDNMRPLIDAIIPYLNDISGIEGFVENFVSALRARFDDPDQLYDYVQLVVDSLSGKIPQENIDYFVALMNDHLEQ